MPTHDQDAQGAEGIRQIKESKLLALISQLADEHDLHFDSILDVGFGGRPLDQWFASFRRSELPRRFVGIEPDTASLEKATAKGLFAYRSFSAPFEIHSDLVVAADVLECMAPASAAAFLKNCAAQTGKMFALSTLNAKYWRKSGVAPGQPWLKWMPDSVVRCYREADDGNRIKNTVDAETVADLMRGAFDAERWTTFVYEAWPWEVRDLSTDQAATFYLKTFAVALAKRG